MKSKVVNRKGTNAIKRRPQVRRRSLAPILRLLQRALPALSEKYEIRSLGVFGSYVRGEQTPTSDLDLLVEYRENTPYETRFKFYQFLSEQLGTKIDLIENHNLKPYIGRLVRQQVIWLQKDGVPQRIAQSRHLVRKRKPKRNGASTMPKREYLDYLEDMLKDMAQVQLYVEGMTYDQMLQDKKTLALC